FQLLDRNWELIGGEQRGQLHVVLPFGTLADVHWHLLNRDVVRRSLSIPMDDVFAGARSVSIDGAPMRTLGAVHTLLHLCVHAALAGGNRLLWLKDIERAVVYDRPDWDEVVDQAQEWQAAVPTGAMLERARRVLGAQVPGGVISQLIRSPGRRLAGRVVDRLSPAPRTCSHRSASALWAQSLRDTAPGGSVLAGRVRLRASTGGRATARFRRAEGAPSLAIFHPAGDETTRSAFFEHVGSVP
ncbi:MAG: nucleotidyltransferase family protein, partial [Acidimicrobiales bacterium]